MGSYNWSFYTEVIASHVIKQQTNEWAVTGWWGNKEKLNER
jgi:hypothetical protein